VVVSWLEPSWAEFVWDVFCVCEHNGETGFRQLVVCNMKLNLHNVALRFETYKREGNVSARVLPLSCRCIDATAVLR
jgi:hypothetical protein